MPLAEWIYEAGIGEERAALVVDGEIVEARIEPERDWARAGAIVEARLTDIVAGGHSAKLALESGEEALIDPAPKGVTEGAPLFVEIVRERIEENWGTKLAKARHRPDAEVERLAPSFKDRITATDITVRSLLAHEDDTLEAAGWSELLEQARSGVVRFPGGALRIALTPAMTVIDVDGAMPPAELAIAAARASGAAVRRFGIGGSIGIDFPTLEAKADRQAVAAALDDALPQPFERTAVNGFGFLQIVRRRIRPSLMELARYSATAFVARRLLRQAERTPGSGERTITAHPAIINALTANPDWLAELERRLGASVRLDADTRARPDGGEVSAAQP